MIPNSTVIALVLAMGAAGSVAGTNRVSTVAGQHLPGLPATTASGAPSLLPAPGTALRVNGVAAFGGKRWAFLVREERGQQPTYLTIEEGKTFGSIYVCEVNAEHAEVLVVVDGKDFLLSLASHEAERRAQQQAETRFVEEHTNAHERLQQRERERLAREAIEATNRRPGQ